MNAAHHILIVDDEASICGACRTILSEQGYTVSTRMTGTSGLDTLEKEDCDVLLLDIKLPDINGMDILQQVHSSLPGVHVIIMTGYATIQNAVDAMKSGAFDYLAKPFSDDELVIAVSRAIEHKLLIEENRALREQLFERYGFDNIIGEDPNILAIFKKIQKVAPMDTTVLIQGESGTGKELFARTLHAHSRRASRLLIPIDCSTFASGVMESELFGHVKGAFTGALENKIGIFEAADGGSLFLDEVANLTPEIQGKLLRVMETGEFKPVGASRLKKANVRIIAATNKNLQTMVLDNTFREDLFYRLNVFPLFIPPLRDRKTDIPRLAYHFLRFYCRKIGKRLKGFSDEAMELLVNHTWPGNVRQLKNVIERLVIIADSGMLDFSKIMDSLEMKQPGPAALIPDSAAALQAFKKKLLDVHFGRTEKAFLIQALNKAGGNITLAAKQVGMQRSNFSTLMKKHHLRGEHTRP